MISVKIQKKLVRLDEEEESFVFIEHAFWFGKLSEYLNKVYISCFCIHFIHWSPLVENGQKVITNMTWVSLLLILFIPCTPCSMHIAIQIRKEPRFLSTRWVWSKGPGQSKLWRVEPSIYRRQRKKKRKKKDGQLSILL